MSNILKYSLYCLISLCLFSNSFVYELLEIGNFYTYLSFYTQLTVFCIFVVVQALYLVLDRNNCDLALTYSMVFVNFIFIINTIISELFFNHYFSIVYYIPQIIISIILIIFDIRALIYANDKFKENKNIIIFVSISFLFYLMILVGRTLIYTHLIEVYCYIFGFIVLTIYLIDIILFVVKPKLLNNRQRILHLVLLDSLLISVLLTICGGEYSFLDISKHDPFLISIVTSYFVAPVIIIKIVLDILIYFVQKAKQKEANKMSETTENSQIL